MFKEVLLVEEEDDGGLDEPLVVADGVEQLHGLHHAVHFFVLGEDQVVTAQGYAENDGGDALETVDPLFPLGSLATHVEHFEVKTFVAELGLDDTRCLHSCAKYILKCKQA